MDKQWGRQQPGVAKPKPVFPELRKTINYLFYRWETEARWKGSSDAASLMERSLLKERRGVSSRQGLKEWRGVWASQEFVATDHCCYSKANTYFKLVLKPHCETEFKIISEACHSVTPLFFRNQTQSHAAPPICSLWSLLACQYCKSQRFKDKDFYVGVIAFLKPASMSEERRWVLEHVCSSGKMRWISNLTASQEQLFWV